MDRTVRLQIEDTVNQLDFHRIRMVMEYLQWEWEDVGVPTQAILYESAMDLLYQAYAAVEGYIPCVKATGGLRGACTLVSEDGVNYYLFELDFIIASSNSA